MGILDDTLSDAARPLPGNQTLRRSADVAFDDLAPEPADPPEDGALTVYRLQKSGDDQSPVAPADPRATDAGARVQRPLRAPAVNPGSSLDHDASPRVVNWISGLETGEEQASRRQLDVTDKHERWVPPDPIHPSRDAVSTGYPAASSRSPDTSERTSDLVQRENSNGDTRREAGRGATSGDFSAGATASPHPAAADAVPADDKVDLTGARTTVPPGAAIAADARLAARTATTTEREHPSASKTKQPIARPLPTGPAVLDDREPAAAQALPAGDSGPDRGPAATGGFPRPATRVASIEPGAAARSESSREAPRFLPPPLSTPAPPPSSDRGPQLRIGQIDVVVLAEPQAAKASVLPDRDTSFLSRNYLRRV